jgi:hypothetical protein
MCRRISGIYAWSRAIGCPIDIAAVSTGPSPSTHLPILGKSTRLRITTIHICFNGKPEQKSHFLLQIQKAFLYLQPFS